VYGAVYAGQKARIYLEGKKTVVAAVTVGSNDIFTASAPLPPYSARARAKYFVKIGNVRSVVLSLARRLILNPAVYANGHVTISGTVVAPLARRPAPVIVHQRLLCGRLVTLARFRPTANGSYTATFPAPDGARAAVFSAYTHVPQSASRKTLIGTRGLAQVVALP